MSKMEWIINDDANPMPEGWFLVWNSLKNLPMLLRHKNGRLYGTHGLVAKKNVSHWARIKKP